MWAHVHCCGCDHKATCCDGGMVTNTNRRGLFGPSNQVCVYDPLSPVSLEIGVTGNRSESSTATGDPCSPATHVRTCSGTINLLSTDTTNPGGASVFGQACYPKLSQHHVEFTTLLGNPDNLSITTTDDDNCDPAIIDTDEAPLSVLLRPFWNVAAGTNWLEFNLSGVANFQLQGVGAQLVIVSGMGLSYIPGNPANDFSGTRSFTGSDPCSLDTSVSLSHSFSGTVAGAAFTSTINVTVTTEWHGLFRCNPEELAALHRAQRRDGRRPHQLARVLGGGRVLA